jgi:RNA polymerase sigma-70 factor (ECF subfamily)
VNALGALNDLEQQPACDLMTDAERDFEALFHQYFAAVYGILVRLVKNGVEAEELALEVFWKLSKRPSGWFFSRPVGPWLYRTATNTGLDAIRMAKRRQKYEEGASPAISSEEQPLERVLREENRRAVQEVLSQMKVVQAQLLLMRATGCSYKELAGAAGVRVSSIGTLLARAEAEFQKRYIERTARKERP